MKNDSFKVVFALIVGGLVGFFASQSLFPSKSNGVSSKEENKPLYWVAPMNPNYRRDGPGKSPMGMDLIPVYEEGSKANDAGPGTINISPSVINNLGVRTAKAGIKALQEKIHTVGYVKYDENKLIHIHPRVSGWVDKLHVKSAGDPVKKGAPLYALYSPELVNAQEELVLALNRNNSRLVKAAEDRLRALQIPQIYIEKLKSSKSIAQNITFYSPQDGVVDNLNIREGFYVQPGTTLFSIGSLSQVWVEAEVFERQAALVQKGAKVTMTLDYLPGTVWEGEVDYIYPTLDSKTRTVRLRLQFDNPQNQLLPNMFAQVVIHSQSQAPTLLIPKEALIRTGAQDRVVLALGEGSFKSIAVEAGREDLNNVEILSGLDEGDDVVASAQFLLDSESSKTSDFKRMTQSDMPETIWVAAQIKDRQTQERVVKVSHEDISEWNMNGMTMNFLVAETVDIDALTPGTHLHMQIQKSDSGMFEIVGTHIMESSAEPASQAVQWADVTGTINAVNAEYRTVNISRGSIEKWNRPAATMDFKVAESIDMASFTVGSDIQFRFEIRDGDFMVVRIETHVHHQGGQE